MNWAKMLNKNSFFPCSIVKKILNLVEENKARKERKFYI